MGDTLAGRQRQLRNALYSPDLHYQ